MPGTLTIRDMTEIPKAYEPKTVEDKWYGKWIEQGCFTADPARVSPSRPAYSIVIPPPNVTGVLTLGHVLNNTIQDILSRKARMDGKEVLWLPGTDHAGIATQTVVERTLKKAGEIRHRDDLGREKFLEKVWQWKTEKGGIIIQQLKKIGASCDWDRERFTMDPAYSRCVQRVFVDLYKKGMIYRGKRMVNWCPVSLTALSDEEVVMKEQKGFMYHFRVEVAELPGTFLTIATTRPETIPADTAVAVNPKDPRYQHLIGKHVIRALPVELPKDQRRIPIVADEHVDFEFGTGVLKVTPAHDKADFEIGLRHGLPVVDILTPDGRMTAEAGPELAGLDRFAARKKSAEILEAHGALDKAEPYVNNVGFSERADVPIEPRLSEQWFLKYPSAAAAKTVVATGRMRFYPDRWSKVYDNWMGGLQDWCISRQLWWGHRVPVWRLKDSEAVFGGIRQSLESGQFGANGDTSFSSAPGESTRLRLVSHPIDGQVLEAATDSPEEGARLESLGFVQDADVLDTWFSSWLWPFATMGWTGKPETDRQNPWLKAFYPTTDLVTGPDIIFFWVARMIMAGYEYMGAEPFQNVYFTGIIRDKLGRKMSKSLGNSPDPLDLIASYGADALRFGVMRSAPLGQDILFDEQAVELGRNFCNKLWNACRFRQMQNLGDDVVEGEIDPALLSSDDRWILLRLDQAIREVTSALAGYNFSEATSVLYRFFWSEYCDWFIEASKAALVRPEDVATTSPGNLRAAKNKVAVIDFILGNTLRLFHPFLPFITEELWHGLGYQHDLPADRGGQTIMRATWPKAFSEEEKEYFGLDSTAEQLASAKYALVSLGRNLKAQANVPSNKRVPFVLRPSGQLAAQEIEVIRLLLNADVLTVVGADWSPSKGTPVAANELGELYLPLAGLMDFAAERARLTKEIEKAKNEIKKVEDKLGNPSFVQKVPASVLSEHQGRLGDWQTKLRQLETSLAELPSGA